MSDQRAVLLVVHTGRDEATETARRVQKVLGDNGIALRVLPAEAVDRGRLHLAPDEMRALGVDINVVEPDEHAAVGCELVLVLGGDGTFLRAAELARNAPASNASPRPAADLNALIAEAAKDLADYQRLTAEGKLGEAGQKLEELKRALDKLNTRQR